jgi:small subunit ribosomal protein S21
MIIVKVENKGGSSIDKALRKLKKKFDNTKVMKSLRERREFTKPSVKKRNKKKRAIYIKKQYGDQD